MTDKELERRMAECLGRIAKERFRGTVSEWCEANVRFNEPGRVGKFSLHQREYLREPLDCYGLDEVPDVVMTFGTRTGKTTCLYAGTAFKVFQKAIRALFVKPTTKGTAGAEGDARTRFIPMLRSSDCLRDLIPSGSLRHNFKTAQQMLRNGSIIDWTGSNSVANLASNSMELVNQDEVDKFNITRRKDEDGNTVEADASDLADERTGEFKNPKRVKASTPTLPSGRIWVELLKTDLRRRFMPCPLCGRNHPSSRLIILAWSEQFTVLPKVGIDGKPLPLAYVKWDKEARKENGEWDLQRVEKSAGYECPHCGGRFRDEHKPWMDANGVWVPTQTGAPRTHGYHLPSMYANHDQTTAGKLALDFLEGTRSLEGPRNFINSKLAEPYAAQDVSGKRVEQVARIEVLAEWKKLMTLDCQAKSPHFWHIIRAWGGREIVGLKGGPLETWDDVRSAQTAGGVADAGVIVDSGFGAKDDAEVYRTCAAYGEVIEDRATNKLIHLGWNPAKGMPNRLWRDKESGVYLPYYRRPIDPYIGLAEAGTHLIEVFEFASDYFNDILETLRRNGAKSRYHWSIHHDLDTDEYHLHMRGEIKDDLKSPGRPKWRLRHRYAPNHLRDCEKMQVAAAAEYGLLEIHEPKPKQEPTKAEEIAASFAESQNEPVTA